ncbi:MAG: helix-turn-helix transcriptional regulator [Clostridiaceae bacterium]|nr:helix-turn-helix transcriptional regulator [Clostridiaceae bacterium]
MLKHNKFLKAIFRPADTLSLRSISKKNLPYFIAWIAVFTWIYAYILPMGGFKFESNLYNQIVDDSTVIFYIWLIAGCITPVLFSGRKFVPKTFYFVITAMASFIVIRFTGDSIVSKIIMIIGATCIGYIFSACVYAFFMVLNNAEKFYSMILAVLLPRLLLFAKPVLSWQYSALDPATVIVIIVIIILAVCSYFFKYNVDSMPETDNIKAPAKAYSLMPLVFVILALNDVIAPACLNQSSGISKAQIEGFYFIGILLGVIIVIILQKRFLINICNMLNISFALLAIGFVADIISMQDNSGKIVSALCFGCSYSIGFINMYYLAGFMAKKFQSIKFYRVGIILSAIYYLVAFISLDLFENIEFLPYSIFMAFISICIVIIFFILSPFFIRMLYSGEWIDDSYRDDVTNCSRLEAKLRDYKLTPAEIDVCRLLLEGCTLRQISGILSKAYATINTYCTSIYRKMNINSRAELLLILQQYIKK